MVVPVTYYLALSVALFTLGVIGVIIRRNAIVIFMCIEMMLNSVYFLICFMSFACNKNYIILFCYFYRLFYCFLPVLFRRIVIGRNTIFNFFDNLKWIFKSRIIRSNNCMVTVLGCNFPHLRSFEPISVAAAPENSYNFSF